MKSLKLESNILDSGHFNSLMCTFFAVRACPVGVGVSDPTKTVLNQIISGRSSGFFPVYVLECVYREAMHVLFSSRGAITGLLIVLCKSAQAKILKKCSICCHFVPTAESLSSSSSL